MSRAANCDLLCRVGQTVYGSHWQKPMAEFLNVSTRHMVRWANGDYPVPDRLMSGESLANALYRLLVEHEVEVFKVAATVQLVRDGLNDAD